MLTGAAMIYLQIQKGEKKNVENVMQSKSSVKHIETLVDQHLPLQKLVEKQHETIVRFVHEIELIYMEPDRGKDKLADLRKKMHSFQAKMNLLFPNDFPKHLIEALQENVGIAEDIADEALENIPVFQFIQLLRDGEDVLEELLITIGEVEKELDKRANRISKAVSQAGEITGKNVSIISDVFTQLIRQSIWIMLITVLMIIVAQTIFFFLLRKRFKELSLVIASVSEGGELSQRVDASTKDEIGTLASLFNSMMERLQKSHEELKSANKHLVENQEQLIQTEKMASLGRLVAGVSHELNTPVGIGVTAASHLLKLTSKIETSYKNNTLTKSAIEDYLTDASEISRIILEHLNRTSELIRSFKMVSVDQASEEKRMFNLKSYIESVLLSLSPKLKKTNLHIETNCPDSLELNSYPGSFAQILTNLIVNSMDHAYENNAKGLIRIDVSLKKDNRILFKYSDDGKGISKENQKEIFEPFFTTNRFGGGTGLGMHIVFNIVTQVFKGNIICESEEGKGTAFIIDFPIEL